MTHIHDRGARMFGQIFGRVGFVLALIYGLVAWVFLC